MKKKCVIFIFCLCITFQIFSQGDDYYGRNLNSSLYSAHQVIGNPTPQPPDASAFQKVNFVPVSNYTGRADINIPIYTIKSGNISVPISLSYNSSGVKVNDMASSVGLNWSLNAGGMISKITRGMDDFYNESGGSKGWLNRSNIYSRFYYPHKDDSEPDLFVAESPGISTKFICKSSITTTGGSTTFNELNFYELENKGNVISVPQMNSSSNNNVFDLKGFKKIQIKSINGIVYSFGSEERTFHIPAFTSLFNSQIYSAQVSGYRLDKIQDKGTNQVVDFEYQEYSVSFSDEIKQKGNSYNGGSNIRFTVSGSSKTTYPKLQRLKTIKFEDGKVEFVYGKKRSDNPDDKMLTEIKVKSKEGKVIKHFKLRQSYFQSNINPSTPQSKRLRLDEVYQVNTNMNKLPGYSFEYDTSHPMPPRGSYAHDYLGYNNGSYRASNRNPIPRYYLSYSNTVNSKYINVTPFNSGRSIPIPGNFSLAPDVNYAKAYSLKKITYPTGGFNKYDYELNTFYHEGRTRSGGGLRLKSQTLNDGKGNTQILDYTYESGSISNFPIFAFLKGNLPPNGLTSFSQLNIGIDTFLAPQSQIEFTQGAFVGYGRVKVKNRFDKGYSEYSYTSNGTKKYENLRPKLTYNSRHYPSKNWRMITPPTLYVDRDFLRGRIQTESVYKKNGDLRLHKEFHYKQKVFETIKLKYLNKSSSHPSDLCYDENGKYKLNQNKCGGFYEEIEIPIERNLLTKVITRDSPEGYDSDSQAGNDLVKKFIRTQQEYTYDARLPLIKSEYKRVSSCAEEGRIDTQNCTALKSEYDDRVSKEYTYPKTYTDRGYTISNLPLANQLVVANRLATPLRVEFKNKNDEIIAKEEHIYKRYNVTGNDIIALEKVNFIARDGSVTPSDKITKRDNKGRIIEYQRKDGVYISRIYGYTNFSLLVAEVINARYDTVMYTLKNRISTRFNQSTFDNSTSLRTMFKQLRQHLSNTQITSYTHKKMIGISSITDIRGKTAFYQYDNFNRLKYIKDDNNKVLKEYKYRYKN